MLVLLLTPLILFLAVYAFCLLVVGLLSRLDVSWLTRPEPLPVPKVADMPPDIARLTQPMQISDLQVVILALLGAAIVALPFMLFIINH
jgi:F0F1-type ATP synthase assembly protein I